MKKLLQVIGLVCIAGQLAFAAASNQGCESSGNTAAGCGGTTNNGGHGGNGGNGGSGGQGGAANANNSVTNTNTNTAFGGSSSATGGVASATGGASSSASEAASTANGGSASANGNVNVGGDTIKTKVYSYGHSAPSAQAGSDAFSVGSIFGGIGIAMTETYVKVQAYITELDAMHTEKLLTDDECKTKKLEALKRLDRASRGRSRHLLNVFGLL